MIRFSPRVSALAAVVILTPALAGCGINAIPTKEEAAKARWADVQSQYQRRADLVPNLVATVQGAAIAERTTLTQVIEARAQATGATVTPETLNDPAAFQRYQAAQGQLSQALSRLLLVVESESQLEEAVRQPVRIGLDEVEAWIPAVEATHAHEWTSTIPRILTSELSAALAEDPGALVLDVRGADEFVAGHVEGAVNIAYTRLGARLGDLPDRRPVYVHCGSGLRASMAVSYLAAKGIDVVHVDGNFGEIGACALPAS